MEIEVVGCPLKYLTQLCLYMKIYEILEAGSLNMHIALNTRLVTKTTNCMIVCCFQINRPKSFLADDIQVAIATAAKAKLLLREIKTVKADLTFAKERSCQLEEENKMLREAREKGDHPTDDDMVHANVPLVLNTLFG